MLFTSSNLTVTEIKKSDYKCDRDYYKSILKCKGLYIPNAILEDVFGLYSSIMIKVFFCLINSKAKHVPAKP